MTLLTLGRAFREGGIHFWRNVWLSLAATAVMMLTLVMVSVLLIVSVLGQNLLTSIESKVDMTIFMADAANETAILAVKGDVEGRGDVESVTYVTKDQALAAFKDRHKANPIVDRALEQL